MIIPLVVGAFFLGRAFDMKKLNSPQKYIFNNEDVTENILTIHKTYTRSDYKIVESSSDVMNFLDVSGELSLKAKNNNINLMGHGSYLSETIDREKTVELLLTVYYETITETFPTYLEPRRDWMNRPQSEVGTHYIRSIIYGGQLVISFQMRTNSSENMEEIKAAVNAHLQVSGSLDADVAGKLELIEKAIRGKCTIYIYTCSTAPIHKQPQNLNDTFELIDEYPSLVREKNNGTGTAMRIELVPLSTLNPKFTSSMRHEAVSEIMNEAVNKFDDLRLADSKYRAWLREEDPPEEFQRIISDYETQLKDAKRSMVRAISSLDLSKELDVHHFDEAFAKYAVGGFNVPYRYTRNLSKLMNLVHNVKPRWYPYTRAVTQYTHWGSVNCTMPSPDPLVVGLAASSPSGFGSGSSLHCLGADPQLEPSNLETGMKVSSINGLRFRSPEGNTGPLFCAYCQLENATSVITVPAKKKCPLGMKLEYRGFLATGSEAVSTPICIDINPDITHDDIYPVGDDTSVNILNPLWMTCDNCYEEKNYLPCVVCSR